MGIGAKRFTIHTSDAGLEAYQEHYVHDLEAEIRLLMDSMETAWGVIANAYGGDWEKASGEWKEAAERWRDEHWHPSLDRNPRRVDEKVEE